MQFVNVDHLFIFILAIINLYEFYLYSSYKKSRQEVNSPDKTEKKAKRLNQEELLQMLANDINSKIATSTKYGAFDENGNFLISFEKAKLINKDFQIFL